jgi:hypothetical protein
MTLGEMPTGSEIDRHWAIGSDREIGMVAQVNSSLGGSWFKERRIV